MVAMETVKLVLEGKQEKESFKSAYCYVHPCWDCMDLLSERMALMGLEHQPRYLYPRKFGERLG